MILSQGTARAEFALVAPDQLQIRIAVGAGPVVGEQVPVSLDPNAPESFTVQVPPAGSAVRANVQSDINAIFLALGAVALLIGGLGIANVTMLSVRERVGEIGLRRALGATRREVGAQLVVESVIVGLLGGLIGAALSALAGGLIGLAAGSYPALKVAAIEPITALRGGI